MRRVSPHLVFGILLCFVAISSASAQVARVFLTGTGTCTIVNNTRGTEAGTDSTGSATIRVTNSTIYHNGDGMLFYGAGAAIESYGNNRVSANTSSSTFSGTVVLQ